MYEASHVIIPIVPEAEADAGVLAVAKIKLPFLTSKSTTPLTPPRPRSTSLSALVAFHFVLKTRLLAISPSLTLTASILATC